MTILRMIFFGVTMLPLWAVGDSSELVKVEPSTPAVSYFIGPEWEYRGVTISVESGCYLDRSFLEWPKASCRPLLRANSLSLDAGNYREVTISADNFEVYAGRRYLLEDLSGSAEAGGAIFKWLISNKGSTLHLKIVSNYEGSVSHGSFEGDIQLLNFSERVEEYVSVHRKAVDKDLKEEVIKWILSVLMWVVGLPLAIFSSWRFLRWFGPVAIKNLTALVRRVRRIIFDFRVREAALDEAIRHVTRQKISEAESDDMNSLVRKVKGALDQTDIDAAK